MTIKNLFFISILLLLGFCLLTSAEVSEEDAAVVKQFVPEGCEVDKIEKADLDGDSKPELAFAYSGKRNDGMIILKGLTIMKWDGVKYVKQWEYESDYQGEFEWLKTQDMTNDGKLELLLCWNIGHPMVLAVFTWDGKTYKLLGANGVEEEFRSSENMPDITPGIIRVYRPIYATPTSSRFVLYPMSYKWDGSKFVLLYNIRDGKTFGSMKAAEPLKIDGELDDWELEGIPVFYENGPPLIGGEYFELHELSTHVELGDDEHDVLFHPENWRGILDLGAWFDTQWDDKTLYIVVQVADDKLVQEWQGDPSYKGDHVELWFDTDLIGDFDVAKANGDDFQIGISPGNFKEIKPSVYCWLPKAKEGNIKESEVSAKCTNDGYILEATIPFQFLGIEPQPNKMLGFTLLVSDTDEKEKPQKCMICTSPQYKWGNPTTWDNFVFCMEVIEYTTEQPPSKGVLAYIQGGDLWVKELPDGQAKQLTTDGRNQSPRWSPSGQWLAYLKGDELWVVQPSGADARALSPGDEVYGWYAPGFAWSPVSDTLAYVREGILCVASASEWREREVVNNVIGGIGRIAWSPDGEWFAYDVANDSTYGGLWCIRADGSNASELYNTGTPTPPEELTDGIVLAGWSPDGQNVLFWPQPIFSASIMADGMPLHAIPAHGGEPRELDGGMLLHSGFRAFSPDGKLPAITEGGNRMTWTNKRIAVVDVSSGKLTYLTDEKTAAISPTWSPDGQHIAYVAAPDIGEAYDPEDIQAIVSQCRIWVMNRDGSEKRQLTNDAAYGDEGPLWSSDGRYILFARIDQNERASLWLMRNDGSELNRVVDELTSPDYIPYGYLNWDNFDWWRGK